MERNEVHETVAHLVDPITREKGLELVEVEYQPRGRRSVLRLYVDRPGGISLDDLATLSREIGDVLDAHDAVPGTYTLECSSPGVNRPLRSADDFLRHVGKRAKIRTLAPIEGRRSFVGKIAACAGAEVEIEEERGARRVIPLGAIERAHYEHDFSEDLRSSRS